MNEINKRSDNQDILNYWLSLYPKGITKENFEELVNNTSEFSLDEMGEFIEEQNDEIETLLGTIMENQSLEEFTERFSQIEKKELMSSLFSRIIGYYYKEFYELVFNNELINNQIIDQFLMNTCETLVEISGRSVILDINICRLEDRLQGANSEERYQYYMKYLLKDPEYQKKFYSEYKHLFSLSVTVVKNAYKYIQEVLHNLSEHIEEICISFFKTDTPLQIKSISMGQGDTHRKGKNVSVVTFYNEKKLVYKPRSMGVECGFNCFLEWINKEVMTQEEHLHVLKIMDFQIFGITEFIEYYECSYEYELEQYYYRIGVLLAALYILNAKDMHNENIISAGSQPVLIDLEALFHSTTTLQTEGGTRHDAITQAYKWLDSSVYSIGLLPMQITNPYSDDEEAIDVSGLGGEEEQLSPFKTYTIVNKGSDEIRIERTRLKLKPQDNIPQLNGEKKTAQDYKLFIENGFKDVYLKVMNQKKQVKEHINYIFKETEGRIILRPTYLYSQLIGSSFHPDYMRARVHRFILLNRLGYGLKHPLNKIVKSEINDILEGDIPFFTSRIDQKYIYDSQGKKLPMEHSVTPLDYVLEKIEGMNEKQLALQVQIIDGAFISKSLKEYRNFWKTDTEFKGNPSTRYLKWAMLIGDYIEEASIAGVTEQGVDRSWIGFLPVGMEHINYQYAVIEGDLYNGNAGIALFMAYLGMLSGKEKYLKIAKEAIRPVIDTMYKIKRDSCYLIGLHNGLAGYIYAVSHLYTITKEQEYLEAVRAGIGLMEYLVPGDRSYDVIGGSAGALQVMCSLYKKKEYEKEAKQLRKVITSLVDHLLKNAVYEGDMVYWDSQERKIFYSGYAHGSSGIIASIYQAAEIIDLEEADGLVRGVLNFEHGVFNEHERNWATYSHAEEYAVGWCHGAPGILLERLGLLKAGFSSVGLKKDIMCAIDTTLNKGFGNSICYCHGDIGNLEILEQVALFFEDKNLLHRCYSTYDEIVQKFLLYIGENKMLPIGLMLGVAGIGYSLLRKISDEVPFILELE